MIPARLMRITVELQSCEEADRCRKIGIMDGKPLWLATPDGKRWSCNFYDTELAAVVFLKLCARRLSR
jgi:hypothetical protein